VTAALATWELRAAFARRLAAMYGREVPAYETLVEVTCAVNADVVAADRERAERLGSVERVTAERHGAIRVGTPQELAQAARVFAAFGMAPVGFYDLRDAGPGAVPVVSTAFRPVDPGELARNPFRVFTSMLVADDRRYFDAATTARLREVLARRTLFAPELLALADRAAAAGGLPADAAEELLTRATAAFALSTEPVDRDWYDHLEAISSVAADVGGVPTTHVNHLTPRVLDIDALQERMTARGITMIEEIQGPPRWEGPDVLLRQTSFRALAEERRFRHADGSVRTGHLRVRFGEVEQRGVALTPRGRDLYDRISGERGAALLAAWRAHLPPTERELARRDLAFFTYAAAGAPPGHVSSATLRTPTVRSATPLTSPGGPADLHALVDAGVLVERPIVYEDFLPRSAAGIFRSNLTADAATGPATETGPPYDLDRLAGIVDRPVHDPMDLYAAQREASLRAAEQALHTTIGRPA
jgi:uncharacterized glyoxalase superfamily metalloenzyme YdcJ